MYSVHLALPIMALFICPFLRGAAASIGLKYDDVMSAADYGQQAFSAVQLVVGALSRDQANGTAIRIGVNGANKTTWDYEGSVGIIWAFNNFNHLLGSTDLKPGGRIEQGGDSDDIEVHQFLGERSTAQYLDIIASDDEICISYIISSTFDSKKDPYIWLGDVGRACGQSWEHGNLDLDGGGGITHTPSCVWLDQDHGDDIDEKKQTDTITNRQMKINMFAQLGPGGEGESSIFSQYQPVDIDYVCGSTIFTHDMDDPIPGETPRGPKVDKSNGKRIPDAALQEWQRVQAGLPAVVFEEPPSDLPAVEFTAPPKKRSSKIARPQSKRMAEKLWVNSNPSQSAKSLCNSPTSRGSDFVSVDEGLFCDMDTKTLYDLCTPKKRTHCFDLHADKLQLRRRDGALPSIWRGQQRHKQYKKIEYVGQSGGNAGLR